MFGLAYRQSKSFYKSGTPPNTRDWIPHTLTTDVTSAYEVAQKLLSGRQADRVVVWYSSRGTAYGLGKPKMVIGEIISLYGHWFLLEDGTRIRHK